MLQYEELRLKLENLKPDLDDLADALGLKRLAVEVEELEMKAAEPGFWDDPEASQKILQRTGALKDKINAYHALTEKYEDWRTRRATCRSWQKPKRASRTWKANWKRSGCPRC